MRSIHDTLMDKKASNPSRQFVSVCRFCGQPIVSNAIVCLRCRRDLRSGQSLDPAKNISSASRNGFGWLVMAALILALVYFWRIKGTPLDPFATQPPVAASVRQASGPAAESPPAAPTPPRTQPATHAAPSPQPTPAVRPAERPAPPPAPAKTLRKEVPCPTCKGSGYTLSAFNQRQLKCLNCQGKGTVMRTEKVEP